MSAPGDLRVDVAVVGLGLIGSAVLRELADAGASVAGVGPAEPPDLRAHAGPFASHYDSGRITRHLDARWEWAMLAARSIARYGEHEARSGIAFHHPSGAAMAETDPARIASILANAERLGTPVVVSTDDDPVGRSPLLRYPSGTTVISEPSPAGHVDPRRMLAANLAIAEAQGAAIVRDAALAAGPHVEGGYEVRTGSGTVRAERLVLAAGPHTDELWTGLPTMEPRAEAVVMATLDAAEAERLAGLHSVLAVLDDHPAYEDLYLVPPTTYPDGTVRLKLGATTDPYRPMPTTEAKRAWMAGDAHVEQLPDLRALLEDLVPGLRAMAWETKPCLITETPSDLPYLDHVDDGVVLAAGGNGYAAKSANAIGEVAARLALAGTWSDADLAADAFSVT